MKKCICLVLSIMLVFSCFTFTGHAEEAYPESEHNYQNFSVDEQSYTFPKQAEGLFVTFSGSTNVRRGRYTHLLTEEQAQKEDFYKFVDNEQMTVGDFIEITLSDGRLFGMYTGTELAGKTLYLPGNRFQITLRSDGDLTAYGYRITRISDTAPNHMAVAKFVTPNGVYASLLQEGEPVSLYYGLKNYVYGKEAIIGWRDESGKAYYYHNEPSHPDFQKNAAVSDSVEVVLANLQDEFDTGILAQKDETYVFDAITCKVGIEPQETFSFTNSSSVFERDGLGYFYTDKHFFRQYLNYSTFALTPVAPMAAAVCAVMTLYWPTMEFDGSCCGFPIAVLLQHRGMIDLLSEQNVDCVRELQPTDELVSTINMYNNAAAPNFVSNNMGLERGTKDYQRQLKKLYTTLEKGKPVYFEYLYGEQHLLTSIVKFEFDKIESCHGILMTGAYTDPNGNHIIFGDNNWYSSYSQGEPQVYVINRDFTDIYCGSTLIKGFSWSADVARYQTFKTEGISNPFSWSIGFWRNLFENLFELIRAWFKKA